MPRRARAAEPTPPLVAGARFRRRNYGRNHAYFDLSTGQKIPGVTTIINDGIPKPALTHWAAREVAEYVADNLDTIARFGGRNAIVGALKEVPFDNRDAAANRGTEVHRLAGLLHRGEEVEVPEVIAGHVDSCVRFLDEWQPRDELLERSGCNFRWRYAGTLDLICTLRDGRRALIDYKTSRSGVFAETALQLAAYRRFEALLDDAGGEVPMPEVDVTLAVWIRDDGYDVFPVDTSDDVFKGFLWAKGVGSFLATGRDRIGSPLARPGRAA